VAIEAIFYAIGFLSCLLLLTVIVEVNDKDKKAKKRLRQSYRTQLNEQALEREQEDFNIDVEIY
jgi:hypothetical protein